MTASPKAFGYRDAKPLPTDPFLWPQVLALCGEIRPGMRVLDVGCGNGYMCGRFLERRCAVVGTDLSEDGIAIARQTHPGARFEVMPADEKLLDRLGERPFDLVISTEVVEHLYAPRPYVRGCYDALRVGGRFICSTPYHGYLKWVALAICGAMDTHVGALWDGGHIKFWSRKTLTRLLMEAGFSNIRFRGAGRYPYVWMSMVMSGDRE